MPSDHVLPPASRPVQRAPRVLLVDDEPSVLRTLVRVLKQRRPAWEVSAVDSAFLAFDMLRAQHFDVLVTDLSMPGVTGKDLLEYAIRQCPAMVRVVHSALLDVPGAERLADLCHIVLSKPVKPEILVSIIADAMNRGAHRIVAGEDPH